MSHHDFSFILTIRFNMEKTVLSIRLAICLKFFIFIKLDQPRVPEQLSHNPSSILTQSKVNIGILAFNLHSPWSLKLSSFHTILLVDCNVNSLIMIQWLAQSPGTLDIGFAFLGFRAWLGFDQGLRNLTWACHSLCYGPLPATCSVCTKKHKTVSDTVTGIWGNRS